MNSLAAMLTIINAKWKSSGPSELAMQTLIQSYPVRVLLAIPQEFLLQLLPQAILQSIIKQKKRNKRTRLQYKKRRALHVTVQLLVKEVEHTVQTKQKKPDKHVVL